MTRRLHTNRKTVRAAGRKPIDLSAGWPHPSLLPPLYLRSSAQTVLSDVQTSTPALRYGPDAGYVPLRQEIARWLTSFYESKRGITSDEICVTGGASQNLACILQTFTDPIYTRNVWMVSPTYFLACRVIDDAGFAGKMKAVPEDDEGVDVDYLRRAIAESEERAIADRNVEPKLKTPRPWRHIYKHIIYAVPTFANPSGRLMTLRRREQLVRIAREFDALVITDDVYDMLVWRWLTPEASVGISQPPIRTAVLPRLVDIDKSMPASENTFVNPFGNVVSNGTFSKIVAPGCRTGWAEGTAKFAWGLSQTGSSRSGGSPSHFTSTLIHDMLKSGVLEKHIYDTLQPAYTERWTIMMSALTESVVPLGVAVVGTEASANYVGGYFIYLTLPASLDAQDIQQRAEKDYQLKMLAGAQARVEGDEAELTRYKQGIRLSFAWEDKDILAEGVRRLADVITDALRHAEKLPKDE